MIAPVIWFVTNHPDMFSFIVGCASGVILFTFTVLALIADPISRALKAPVSTGPTAMTGERVRVISIGPGEGACAIVRGEYWKVMPAERDETLPVGTDAIVVRAVARTLTLYVSPAGAVDDDDEEVTHL